MQTVKRRNTAPIYSMCVQPAFLIGTDNEDGSPDFAPITWVSATGEGDGYLLVVSMFGDKLTKRNVLRTGRLSACLVSVDILPLMDAFGSRHGSGGIACAVSRGAVVDVPVLDASRWVYECEVERQTVTGDSTTFFCRVRNIQIDERLDPGGVFDIDLTRLDPVVYSGKYHSIGRLLGSIGDFLPKDSGGG